MQLEQHLTLAGYNLRARATAVLLLKGVCDMSLAVATGRSSACADSKWTPPFVVPPSSSRWLAVPGAHSLQ